MYRGASLGQHFLIYNTKSITLTGLRCLQQSTNNPSYIQSRLTTSPPTPYGLEDIANGVPIFSLIVITCGARSARARFAYRNEPRSVISLCQSAAFVSPYGEALSYVNLILLLPREAVSRLRATHSTIFEKPALIGVAGYVSAGSTRVRCVPCQQEKAREGKLERVGMHEVYGGLGGLLLYGIPSSHFPCFLCIA